MGRSRKIRHRAKLVRQTKPPIRAKKLGLPGNESISAKDRMELAARRVRRREKFDAEFHAMSRKEPPHLSLGRTALEQAAIDAYSTAIAEWITAKMRGAPVEIALITKDMKHGTRAKVPSGYTVKLSAFAQLTDAIERRASAGCEV